MEATESSTDRILLLSQGLGTPPWPLFAVRIEPSPQSEEGVQGFLRPFLGLGHNRCQGHNPECMACSWLYWTSPRTCTGGMVITRPVHFFLLPCPFKALVTNRHLQLFWGLPPPPPPQEEPCHMEWSASCFSSVSTRWPADRWSQDSSLGLGRWRSPCCVRPGTGLLCVLVFRVMQRFRGEMHTGQSCALGSSVPLSTLRTMHRSLPVAVKYILSLKKRWVDNLLPIFSSCLRNTEFFFLLTLFFWFTRKRLFKFGYQFCISFVLCKYFLLGSGLSFLSYNSVFSRQDILYFYRLKLFLKAELYLCKSALFYFLFLIMCLCGGVCFVSAVRKP